MSGHSKWATTKHKKPPLTPSAASSSPSSSRTSRSRPVWAAATRMGNPSLYDAIYKAKKASMPADNIKRAVKRGSG